jgi:hypothetical protein
MPGMGSSCTAATNPSATYPAVSTREPTRDHHRQTHLLTHSLPSTVACCRVNPQAREETIRIGNEGGREEGPRSRPGRKLAIDPHWLLRDKSTFRPNKSTDTSSHTSPTPPSSRWTPTSSTEPSTRRPGNVWGQDGNGVCRTLLGLQTSQPLGSECYASLSTGKNLLRRKAVGGCSDIEGVHDDTRGRIWVMVLPGQLTTVSCNFLPPRSQNFLQERFR